MRSVPGQRWLDAVSPNVRWGCCVVALAWYQWAPFPANLLAMPVFLVGAGAWPVAAVQAAVVALPLVQSPRPLVGPWAVAAPEVAIVLLGAAFVGRLLLMGRRAAPGWRNVQTPEWGALALVVLGCVSLLVAVRAPESLRSLRTVIVEPVVLYAIAIAAADDRRAPGRYAAAIVAAGAFASVVGLVQYVINQNLITAEEDIRRIRAFYGSPNNLGLLLDRTLPLAVALVLIGSRPRWLAVGVAAVSAAGMALTLSLGAWAAVAGGLLVVAATAGRRVLYATVAAGVVGVGAALLLIGRSERFLSHLDFSEGTSFLRLRVWQSAVHMVGDHPVLGIGLDNFLYYYRDLGYMLPEAWREPALSHPHNWVLDCWLSLGIVGLLGACWLGSWLVRRALALVRDADRGDRLLAGGVLGAFVATVAHGTIDNSFFLPDLAVLFWMGFAIVRLLSPASGVGGGAGRTPEGGIVG